jgi:hypothetical protein
MAKHDPDRIAALAAGDLGPAEAAILEAEIAADPRAAAELAAQRFALDALRAAPTPVLSAEERTELRRAVAAALHLEDEAPAAVPARRRVPWRPLAVAAAALAALVAVVPLVGLLSVGGDNEAAETTIALSATTTAAAEQFATTDALDGNLTAEGGETVPLGAVSPDERAMDDADKAVADLLEDPAPLFEAPAVPSAPCRDDAVLLLGADDPVGVVVPHAAGELEIWYLPGEARTIRELVAFDALTCRFLAARP